MKNLRNVNQPPNADLVQKYLQSSWDIVVAVYADLANISDVADAINSGTLDQFLTAADIDTLAEFNTIMTDWQAGRFSTQGEAEGGTDNTTTMTPLRVAQAIAVLAAGLLNNYTAIIPPTVTDDSNAGYSVGSYWIDTVGDEVYRCVDAAIGAAVWVKTTLTTDELATVALTGSSDDLIEGVTKLLMTVAERAKLAGIEDSATADQSDSEIETAYNNQVAIVTQIDAEAGTGTAVRRWTPERVKQAIDALSVGGLTWSTANSSIGVTASTGTVFYSLPSTVTATLPASPSVGDMLMIVNNDNEPTDAYNVNIAAGGSNVIKEQNINYIPQATLAQGQSAILVCYDAGATKGWHMQRWVSALDVGTGGGGGGGMTVVSVKTSNYTAGEDEVVPVDSSGGSFIVTMPAAAAAQSRVIVIDVGKSCGTYPVTLARNSQTFDGIAEDFVMDQDNGRVDALADGAGDFDTHLIGTPEVVNVPGGFSGINDQTGTTYQFGADDLIDCVVANNGAASTYSIPDGLGNVGDAVNLYNKGAGTVTINMAGTDTLDTTANACAQYKAVTALKIADTVWAVIGGA